MKQKIVYYGANGRGIDSRGKDVRTMKQVIIPPEMGCGCMIAAAGLAVLLLGLGSNIVEVVKIIWK